MLQAYSNEAQFNKSEGGIWECRPGYIATQARSIEP
jgi:hypothetical protein